VAPARLAKIIAFYKLKEVQPIAKIYKMLSQRMSIDPSSCMDVDLVLNLGENPVVHATVNAAVKSDELRDEAFKATMELLKHVSQQEYRVGTVILACMYVLNTLTANLLEKVKENESEV